jgi:preprotein translocase subunit SecG
MWHALLLIVHFFCAAGIVALVLLQRGKGADAGAGFGAGASGTVFGARGATTALSRATAVLAGVFMITSLSLAYVGAKTPTSSSSLLDRLSHQQTVPATPRNLPRGALPGQMPFGAPSGAAQTPPAAPLSTAPQTPSTGPAPASGSGASSNGAAPAPAPSAPHGNGAGGNNAPR